MDASLIPALHDALLVAQTGSVGEAARRLHKTASAVSQQIRRIEARFGVALFEKVGRGIRPSLAGESVLGSLTRLFDEAASLEILLAELATAPGTTLRVAASDYLGESLLLPEVPGLASARLLLIGTGTKAQYNRRGWRRALQTAIAALARTRIASAAIALERPGARELDDYYFGRSAAEITGACLYRVNDLKSERRARAPALARVLLGPIDAGAIADVRRGLAAGAAVSESARLLRNLGNLPANVCTPRYLAAQARELERSYKRRLRVRVFDEAGIRRLKMGCLLAVTRGSAEPPRFIVLDYRGARRSRPPLVLVGKGVTFDTGGISLKDPPAMDEMKYDMCGAATVLAAIDYAARAELKINLIGLIPTCENMPDGRAVKPGDIVTSASGQTVEILNTDAEGRLILCDAITYSRRFKPAAVIDVATLTGACIIALGHHYSGLMSNTDALADELIAASTRSDDRAWRRSSSSLKRSPNSAPGSKPRYGTDCRMPESSK